MAMVDYKEVLGFIATLLGLIGYWPYFLDLFKGKTKPHAFSWFVWSILTGIAFAAQIMEEAGPASWVTGLSACICFIIFLFALFKGKKTFPVIDWIALVISLVAIFFWRLTGDPTLSVILVTAADALGFFPTFRKSYYQPFGETLSTFIFATIKWIPAIMALENYTISTWLYPLSLVVMNGAFVCMLFLRRKQLRASSK